MIFGMIIPVFFILKIIFVIGEDYYQFFDSRDTKSSPRRILGGYEVENFAFPWQVSLLKRNKHHCGGSLVSNDLVVTAAHCLVKMRKRLMVRVGSLFREKGGTLVRAEKIVYHEDYDPLDERNYHDIGLVFLKKSLLFSSSLRPLFLPNAFMEIPSGLGVVSSGWGTITYPIKTYPKVLFAVDMKILGNSQCAKILGPDITIAEEQICAYSGMKGQGTCQGDSGGALTYGDILLGVASWGIPCAEGLPDVFAKVSYYIGWILRQHLENIIENEITYNDDRYIDEET